MWTKVIALGATALGAMLTASACGAYDEGADEDVGVAADEIEREPGEALALDASAEGAGEDRSRRCLGSPLREYVSRDPAVCALVKFKCASGDVAFFDECGCGCRRIKPPVSPVGQACGGVTCPAGQECCNASCGVCVPPGGACIQIAC